MVHPIVFNKASSFFLNEISHAITDKDLRDPTASEGDFLEKLIHLLVNH